MSVLKMKAEIHDCIENVIAMLKNERSTWEGADKSLNTEFAVLRTFNTEVGVKIAHHWVSRPKEGKADIYSLVPPF